MSDQWRQIPGWEGLYEVSGDGQVRSMARSVPGRPGVLINRQTRLLTPSINHDGYKVVSLCRENRKREYGVHRLVLMAFVGPAPVSTEACHNDGDKSNNDLGNLRWDSRSANTLDRVKHGTHHFAIKTHCPQGHEYNADNVYLYRGSRSCKQFKRDRKIANNGGKVRAA